MIKPLAERNSRSSLLRAILAGLAMAVLFGSQTDCAWAATNGWISGANASWFTPGNWSLATPPTSGDDALITNNTTAGIVGVTAATAGNLFVNNGGVAVGDISAGHLAVDGEISVGAPGGSGLLTLNIGTISFNTLSVGANGSYSDTAFGTLILTGSNPTIQMASTINVVVNSQITGTNGLIKAGLGTLTLASDNTYSGGTTISAGTLRVGTGGTSGSLGSGDIINNAALVFNRSDGIAVSNAISGSGSLTQAGAGTLTLLGTNTYSGNTIINAGTLQVGDGGTSGSLGSGGISNSSALVFNRSDEVVVSNTISGAGSLTQAGSGTLTLAGNNTYSGGTTISNGTLQVGNGGTSGSLGSGTISNDSALVFNRSDSLLVTSTISGAGSLTQAGGGTLTLTGSNSYSGVTMISTGTLQVGNSGTSGSLGSGDVSNDSALVFNRSDSVALSNIVSGTGSLTQAGTGTLTLLGTNTYSGSTFVNAGTLEIGDGGTAGSLGTGSVSNNSVLVFNHSDDITVSNEISGIGTLTHAGTGALILAGTNSYSGRTIIGMGTLQVGDGGTSGSLGTGAVSNDSVLVFNRSDSIVVSNAVSGTGSLTHDGAGTLIFAGDNSYSGGTFINSATLEVGEGGTSGSLGSGAVINNGALVFNRSDNIIVTNFIGGAGSLTQGGTGTMTLSNLNTYGGGTWINNGGTLSVRDSNALGSGDMNLVNGTLKVNTFAINIGGDYTQSTNGILQIAIGGTNVFGSLNIAGTASLTGTLFLVSTNNYAPSTHDTFVLLAASNGVTGTFSTFTNTISSISTLLNPALAYNANDVTLSWVQGSFVPFAKTRNQRAVARTLDSITNSTSSSSMALIDYLNGIPDPANNLPPAYNQIAPEELTALYTVSLAAMDAQGNQLVKRANELRAGYRGQYIEMYNAYDSEGNAGQAAERPWGVYVEGLGQFVNVDNDSNAKGYDLSGGGVTVGADRRINDQFVVGASLSYLSSDVDLNQNGDITAEDGLAQVYALWFREGFHLEGMFGGSITSYDTKRRGLNGFAKGSTDGTGWTGFLNGGYDWQKGSWSFGPQLGLQYEEASIDSFKEKGSQAPVKVDSQSVDALYTQLGATVRFRHNVEGTWTFITPEVNLAWRHNYSDTTYPLRSRLASGDGSAFTVYGADVGSDSFVASWGTTVQWTADISSYVNCTLQFGQDGYQAKYLTGGLRLAF